LVKLIHALSISFATTPIDQALLKLDSVFLDERLLLDVMIKYGSIQIFGGRYVNETDSAENT
jgi:hypothetical protein